MTKEIELSQGKFALVDDEDHKELNKHKWYACKNYNTYYALSFTKTNEKRKGFFMHRHILGLSKGDGMITDHINRNGLDNRRCNLRTVSLSENMHNHRIHRHNTSGHNGVHWLTANKKWGTQIKVNGEVKYLGSFDNIQDAIEARRQGELKYWGEARSP